MSETNRKLIHRAVLVGFRLTSLINLILHISQDWQIAKSKFPTGNNKNSFKSVSPSQQSKAESSFCFNFQHISKDAVTVRSWIAGSDTGLIELLADTNQNSTNGDWIFEKRNWVVCRDLCNLIIPHPSSSTWQSLLEHAHKLNYFLSVGASDLPKSIIPDSSANLSSCFGTRLQRGFNVTRQPRPTQLGCPHTTSCALCRWASSNNSKASLSFFFFPKRWSGLIQWQGASWLMQPWGLHILKYLERDPEDSSLRTRWFKPFQCNESWSYAASRTNITIWLHPAAQTTLYFEHMSGRGLYSIYSLYKATRRQH